MRIFTMLSLFAILGGQAVMASGAETSGSLVTTYMNPLDPIVADPFVFKDGDTYYLYGTTSPGSGFEVSVSKDLVNWRKRGFCYQPTEASWARHDFWAPELVKRGDKYVLYFTARKGNQRNITMALSDSPCGPFVDVAGPLFPEGSYIDPHIFHDESTGKAYILVTEENVTSNSRLLGAELKDSLTETVTSLTEVLVPDRLWERGWIEAPFVIQHDGTFYLMYSASAFDRPSYAIGYATASKPLGPYKKASANPIIKRQDLVYGPGHNSVTPSPDGKELFVTYHVHASPWSSSRVLAIDRLAFVPGPSGQPSLLTCPTGASSAPQPLPSGAVPMKRGGASIVAGNELDTSRWTIFNEDAKHWRVRDGELVIQTQLGDFYKQACDGKNVFLQYAPDGDFDVSARLNFTPTENHEQAFILVWQDPDNYVKLGTVYAWGLKLEAACEMSGKYDPTLEPNDMGSELTLRISKKGNVYTSYASPDGKTWKQIGEPYKSDIIARRVGFAAISPGSENEREAIFRSFEVTPR